jgi:hypothetical protein
VLLVRMQRAADARMPRTGGKRRRTGGETHGEMSQSVYLYICVCGKELAKLSLIRILQISQR